MRIRCLEMLERLCLIMAIVGVYCRTKDHSFNRDCSNIDTVTDYVTLSSKCQSGIECAALCITQNNKCLSYIYNSTSSVCLGIVDGSSLNGSLPPVSTYSRMTDMNLHKDPECCKKRLYTYLERVNLCVRLRPVIPSFDDASDACTAENSTLVYIPNEEANTEIMSHIENTFDFSKQPRFFIGLKDLNKTGKFTWMSGDPVDYLNWGDGEPDWLTLETCSMLHMSTKKWHNVYCKPQKPFNFICLKRHY